MTIEEFDKTKFDAGMSFMIKGRMHDIASVNFDQKLIGVENYSDPEEIDWYRCENIELYKKKSLFELMNSQPKD